MLPCSNPICWDGLIQTIKDRGKALLPGQRASEYEGKIVVRQWFVENVSDSLQTIMYMSPLIYMLTFCESNLWSFCKNCSGIWISFRLTQVWGFFGLLVFVLVFFFIVLYQITVSPFWPNWMEWWKSEIIKFLQVSPTRRKAVMSLVRYQGKS